MIGATVEHNEGKTRIGRREAVKKAAVAGAVAWSAPMILSSKVSAAGGTCPDTGDCPTTGKFVIAKVDSSTCEDSVSESGQGWSCGRALRDQFGKQISPGGCSYVSSWNLNSEQSTVTLAEGVTVVGVQWKGGKECYINYSVGGNCGNVVTVTRGPGQKGISNISVLMCVPQ